MRRLFTTLSFLAAVLALSRCGFREQEAPEPAGGRPFELVASPGGTKTVNDGLSTKWEQDDPVSVFHAPYGGAAYIADGIFTIDNPETGHATGTITELSQGLYDWYLFYPGNSSYGGKSPGGNAVIPAAQTQSEYGSKAHLAGPGFPLGGKAEKVAWDAVPSVTLQPLAAVVKVHVTNAQATPARVTAVSFTAPEAVAGNFSVSWDGVFSATGENSETVTAAVAGGLLAQGESADIYLGIKPFQAAAGTTLTLRVTLVSDTGAETTAERSVTLSAATPFRRGLIKTLNFSFDGTFDIPDLPQQEIGVYGYAGNDYLYAEGSDQISLRRSGSAYAFRLLRPASAALYELSGLPLTLTPGETLSLTWTGSVNRVRQFGETLSLKVVKVKDGKAWLQSSDQTVFVIKTL